MEPGAQFKQVAVPATVPGASTAITRAQRGGGRLPTRQDLKQALPPGTTVPASARHRTVGDRVAQGASKAATKVMGAGVVDITVGGIGPRGDYTTPGETNFLGGTNGRPSREQRRLSAAREGVETGSWRGTAEAEGSRVMADYTPEHPAGHGRDPLRRMRGELA